ncbi:MAG: pilus assembly protein PilP [Candidatus Rokubacteria bacterium]|nr:pilus assembly protein PilP [Candidatus Rokubacteria bacterium]
MRRLVWTAAVGLVGLLSGCGGSPPPAQAAQVPAPPPPKPAVTPREPQVKPLPAIAYQARGRRDPFRPPVTEVQEKGGPTGLQTASLKLVGIVQGRDSLLALVESADGLGYILRPGDLIGDGRVAEIGPDSVTFTVPGRPGQPPTRTVLKLKTD